MDPSTDGMCQERAGFLFKHACPSWASQSCEQCGKAVCESHLRVTEEGGFCLACAATRPKSEQGAEGEGGEAGDINSPFSYGSSHYSGWGNYHSWGYTTHGHDPNDFTDGDRASVQQEGEAEFENSLEAS